MSTTWRAWLRRKYAAGASAVAPEHRRFYVAAAYGYPCGLLWHGLFIFLFWWVGAIPLALLNVGATAVWALALWLHVSGRLRAAVVLAALEIVAHAAACVAFVGWSSGFHLYIVAMAAVAFFAPLGHLGWNVALATFNAGAYVWLHYLFVDAAPRIALSP